MLPPYFSITHTYSSSGIAANPEAVRQSPKHRNTKKILIILFKFSISTKKSFVKGILPQNAISSYKNSFCGILSSGISFCGILFCGISFCGMTHCDMTPCGMTLCGLSLCGMTPCGIKPCSVSLSGLTFRGMLPYGVAACDMTPRCSPASYHGKQRIFHFRLANPPMLCYTHGQHG